MYANNYIEQIRSFPSGLCYFIQVNIYVENNAFYNNLSNVHLKFVILILSYNNNNNKI